jgi:Domain of unknown function (DUF5103)
MITAKRIYYFIFCCLLTSALFAQQENLRYENYIYADDIRTVQLHLQGAPLSLPIVELKASTNKFVLEFDLMSDEQKDYWYTIVHCNSDWTPSELETNEYLQTFTEDRITEFYNSQNTLTDYVHYTVRLPNKNVAWSISGNYLLKVWEDDSESSLVLTRRFMVVEPTWRVEANSVRLSQVAKQNTHHEIDFVVNALKARIPNPKSDVKAYILQNGRFDNMIGPLPPYAMVGEQLLYDYQDKIVFPAGKEFRFFGMQQFDFREQNVHSVNKMEDVYEVTLRPEKDYSDKSYQYWGDLNGRYSIENNGYYGRGATKSALDAGRALTIAENEEVMRQCDYAKVLFTLEKNMELDDEDVYVFGELTDWMIKPEFKMKYDNEADLYYCEPLLKQGFYNYEFVKVDKKTQKIDIDGFTGNWYEAANQYTILIYFRTFGERFERILAASTIDTRKR